MQNLNKEVNYTQEFSDCQASFIKYIKLKNETFAEVGDINKFLVVQ